MTERDTTADYLRARIDQRLDTTYDGLDEHWNNVVVQELGWALQVHTGEYTDECVLSDKDG